MKFKEMLKRTGDRRALLPVDRRYLAESQIEALRVLERISATLGLGTIYETTDIAVSGPQVTVNFYQMSPKKRQIYSALSIGLKGNSLKVDWVTWEHSWGSPRKENNITRRESYSIHSPAPKTADEWIGDRDFVHIYTITSKFLQIVEEITCQNSKK